MTTEATGDQIVQLDPSKVQAVREDNIRFGLKQTAVDELKASILEHGGVLQPVTVTPLEGVKGFTHRLVFGFNRHAAVAALNTEGAGLTLPAIVREEADEAGRTRLQIAENSDRENLSPMDKAVAIKKLMDSGIEKPEIRRIFSASGGRKGNTVQPMSNAMLNIHLNMLELPKAIQTKIHEGLVGVEAAYMLGKVPVDKRAAVLERAEADRLKQISMEESDEEKLLKSQRRVVELEEKATATEAEVTTAKSEVEQAEQLVKDKIEAMKAIKVGIAQMETPAGPKEVESIKGAEADVKAAQKLLKDAKNKVAKTLKVSNDTKELIKATKAKLEQARKDAKKKKLIGKANIKKAAAAEGTVTGYVALNIGDIRQTMKDITAGKLGADDRVATIAGIFKNCFDGRDPEKSTVGRLTSFLDAMGAKLPPKPAPAPKAPAPAAAKK